jgi:integrase
MRDEERLFKVGRVWHTWVWVKVSGKRVRIKRSTGKRTKSAARLIARQLEEESADPARASAQATTLEDALDEVLQLRREQAKAGERSSETADFFEKKSGVLVRVLGAEAPLATVSAALLDAYVSTRRREQVSDHSIYKELVVMRSALKLAKRRGRWFGDLAAVLPALSPRYEPRTRALTADELDKLLAELEADDAARAAFCVATGAELKATATAQRADVAEAGKVQLRGTKNPARWRVVPLVTDWQRTLLAYALKHVGRKNELRREEAASNRVRDGFRDHQHPQREADPAREGAHLRAAAGALFRKTGDEFRWALRYAARRAGLEHVTPNDLRRTYSTWLRAGGASLETIAPTMGHADTRMLERVYAKLSPELLGARLRAELGLDTVWTDQRKKKRAPGTSETRPQREMVPRGGIEPPTRGFSVPGRIWRAPRENRVPSAAERSHLDRVWTLRATKGDAAS